MRRLNCSAHAHARVHYFCKHGNEFVLITFQWMFPDDNTIILGAVLMVNNKPQGLMLVPPCESSTKLTKFRHRT
jgi:hypothetical protein